MWTALALAAVRPGLATLTQACQVALSLYLRLGARVLLQLEAFLAKLLLPLAAGKASPSSGSVGRQEAALEVLVLLSACNPMMQEAVRGMRGCTHSWGVDMLLGLCLTPKQWP